MKKLYYSIRTAVLKKLLLTRRSVGSVESYCYLSHLLNMMVVLFSSRLPRLQRHVIVNSKKSLNKQRFNSRKVRQLGLERSRNSSRQNYLKRVA